MAKRTNNDLQNTTQKTKDRVTPTPLKTQNGLLIESHTSGSAFDVMLLWEIHSHKTNQQ